MLPAPVHPVSVIMVKNAVVVSVAALWCTSVVVGGGLPSTLISVRENLARKVILHN